MRMQPLEMGNGGSVEEHGEWETSCGMAFFFTPVDWMRFCIWQASELRT